MQNSKTTNYLKYPLKDLSQFLLLFLKKSCTKWTFTQVVRVFLGFSDTPVLSSDTSIPHTSRTSFVNVPYKRLKSKLAKYSGRETIIKIVKKRSTTDQDPSLENSLSNRNLIENASAVIKRQSFRNAKCSQILEMKTGS